MFDIGGFASVSGWIRVHNPTGLDMSVNDRNVQEEAARRRPWISKVIKFYKNVN